METTKQDLVARNIISMSLMKNLLCMTSQAGAMNNKMSTCCADNLSLVAETSGPQNWHCIQTLYQILANSDQVEVCASLTSSLHIMASIEGEEITCHDLAPILDAFWTDLDKVRISILKHLYDFLKILPPDTQLRYLPKVQDFGKTSKHSNWNMRLQLANSSDGWVSCRPVSAPQALSCLSLWNELPEDWKGCLHIVQHCPAHDDLQYQTWLEGAELHMKL